ncbi:MAG: hypothetical protein AB7I50_00705 [Vicinamibacterales bacterium]
MQEQTVIEGIAQYFGTTPYRFSVFFGLACLVCIVAVVIAVMNLSANVPPPEGERKS